MCWKEMKQKVWYGNQGISDWIPCYCTQYPGVSSQYRKQQLVIGLDFGTAFTKVVIGETRVGYAVPFMPYADGRNRYLLPDVFTVEKNGECVLGDGSEPAERFSRLKMRLLEGDHSISNQTEIAAFLALVFRHCRGWLLNTHKATYGDSILDWNINVGLPTETCDDRVMAGTYHNIAQSAWQASIGIGPLFLDSVRRIVERNSTARNDGGSDHAKVWEPNIHPDAIRLFPEFVAQVTGYVRSPSRQPDLHMLMDVGAGTVDVTIFNVHRTDDGEDKFPIFARSVKRLGVQYLARHRIENSDYSGAWRPSAHDIPPSAHEFARKIGISEDRLNSLDGKFLRQVRDQMHKQLEHTKTKRYPLSEKWHEGIPVFLCGGGANMSLYSCLISPAEGMGTPYEHGLIYKLKRGYLPKPERLSAEGVEDKDYDRLSVAYGLSFDALDIGEIEKSGDIEDVFEVDLNRKSGKCEPCKGTGGSMGQCPKCGGSGWVGKPDSC